MCALGRCCRKSRKSKDAENLANGGFWTTPLLRCSVGLIRRSVVVFLRHEVPHVAAHECISGFRKFRLVPLRDFFDSICQERKSPRSFDHCKDRVISVLAPITDSVSTMRGWSYLPAPKEQHLAPPNRPRLAENKRSGSALRSQCRRGDDVVAGPPEQQRHDGAV